MTRFIRPSSWVLAALLVYLLPYGMGSYSIHIANVAVVFAIMAVGEGIALGVGGQVNLAQVAFFGLSAYVVSMLTVKAGWGFWPAALVALAAAIAAGLLVGVPALRVQSHYLGIVTLGLALGFTSWVNNTALAGAANGISGVPIPPLFGVDLSNEYWFFYLAAAIGLVSVGVAMLFVRGRHGRRLRAIRDDSLAAGSLGANVSVLRMASFLIASLYGGIAGILYAGLIRFVSPESFSISTMFLVLAMVIIGGRQSVVGCVVGAVGLIVVREQLSSYSTYAQLGYGVVVVLVVVFAPTGLAGVPQRLAPVWHRLRRIDTTKDRLRLGRFEPASPESNRHGASVRVDDLSIAFRGLKALDGVGFEVPSGQIRGVVGPNGSGKTTLFNIVSGLYQPSSGHVHVDDIVTSGLRPHQISRRGISRTFQNLRLFPTMTVAENVLVGADRSPTASMWRFVALPWGEVRRNRHLRERADSLLTQFGLRDFADSRPGNLPYGIQRRIEICRAMACEPRLLLLDEPAAGLNGEEVGQLRDMVRALRDTGVTVVIVEHNMSLVMSLCDQVTVLSGGRVIADGAPADVVADPAVVTAYLGGTDGGTEREIEAAAAAEAHG